MKYPEKFVPDHLKTKKTFKKAVKKLPIVIMYIPDRNKTQEMFDKVILENGKIIPDCYKNQKMCNKAVDTYLYARLFVLHLFNT